MYFERPFVKQTITVEVPTQVGDGEEVRLETSTYEFVLCTGSSFGLLLNGGDDFGLNWRDAYNYDERPDDCYIAGMANESEAIGGKFIFLNSSLLRSERVFEVLMHECVHLGKMLFGNLNAEGNQERLAEFVSLALREIKKKIYL